MSSDAVGTILTSAEIVEVLNRGVRDGFHGLTGEKGLMARDDDIGKVGYSAKWMHRFHGVATTNLGLPTAPIAMPTSAWPARVHR